MPSLPADAFLILTPFGSVIAVFPEDAPGVSLDGPVDAVAFVERVINTSTDIDGISLSVATLNPSDLLEFCRADGFKVFPPPEDGNTDDVPAPEGVNIGGQQGASSV